MKAKLYTFLSLTMFGLTLGSHHISAWAGVSSQTQVSVQSNSAGGSMAGARYSADNQQYIGCQFSIGSGTEVVCLARDSQGKSFFCYSTHPIHVTAVKAITDSSTLYFASSPSNPTVCDTLYVHNYSDYLR